MFSDPVNLIDPSGLIGSKIPVTPKTTIPVNGVPFTVEGPYKAAPSFIDKIANFGVSKLFVEKFSKKVLKFDVNGNIVPNPLGLGLYMLLYSNKLNDGENLAQFLARKDYVDFMREHKMELYLLYDPIDYLFSDIKQCYR